MDLSILNQRLINSYQKNFPLCSRPFLAIAERFNVSETDILDCFALLQEAEVLSRVGPVFDHQKAGASTLAALAVPVAELDAVAAKVNAFSEINHNYAREHVFNLWFVATAKTSQHLQQVLTAIEQQTGYQALVLPMEASYHIDLGFEVCFDPTTAIGESTHISGNFNRTTGHFS